jgi:hypothetical protein
MPNFILRVARLKLLIYGDVGPFLGLLTLEYEVTIPIIVIMSYEYSPENDEAPIGA